MPTLTRFVTIILVIAAIVYGTAWTLATFVRPTRVEQRVPLPIEDLIREARERDFIGPSRPPSTPGLEEEPMEADAGTADDPETAEGR